MRIPTFTAESCLYKTSRFFHRQQYFSPRGGERLIVTQVASSSVASLVVPATYWCRLNEETGDIECEDERPV